MEKKQLIIFTDLDGTFLRHQDYSYSALNQVLPIIRERDIPLVFCSSKTRKEIERLRREIENHHPFIVENGGAVFWPEGYFPAADTTTRRQGEYLVLELGTPRAQLLAVLQSIRTESGAPIRSFADMTAEELVEASGLPLDTAQMAMEREYDEPFEVLTLDGSVTAQVITRIEQAGLNCTRGGRYWHILGDNDKGKACRLLKERFRQRYFQMITIGLGDSANDLPMLQVVDFAVLVKRADGTYDAAIMDALPEILLADGVGPEGWAQAILPLLANFV
jgi:mannosyl-3-phosphoglycerate phosphatase